MYSQSLPTDHHFRVDRRAPGQGKKERVSAKGFGRFESTGVGDVMTGSHENGICT